MLFHFTVAPDAKLPPLIVRVNAAPPAVADVGAKDAIAGNASIAKAMEADAEVDGLVTLILAEPALVRADAGMLALNCVVLTNVVGSGVPFQLTVAPFWKPLPFTVRINAPEPAGRAEGFREPTVAPRPAIVPLKACEAVCVGTLESVAVTVNVYGPDVIGVPLTVTVAPVVELRNIPAGRVPEEIDHEKGDVPLEREHGADQVFEFNTGGPPAVRQFMASTAGATPVSKLMPPPSSATARSASPSPLKSAAARNDGALPASQGPAVPVWNVPSPRPASRVMAFDAESANRRSILPSPLKSPAMAE